MFRNLKKEKELIDRELAVYKLERMNKIDKDVEEFRAQKRVDTNEMLRKGLQQLGEYEHEFHQTKETRGIELEKLNAKLEALKAEIAGKDEVLKNKQELVDATTASVEAIKLVVQAKEDEIQRLNDLLNKFIENQPEQVFVNKLR
jgi:chromosome segregation ATPase